MSRHSLLLVILLSLFSFTTILWVSGCWCFRVPLFFPFLSVEESPFFTSFMQNSCLLVYLFFYSAFFCAVQGCYRERGGVFFKKKNLCGLLWRIICGFTSSIKLKRENYSELMRECLDNGGEGRGSIRLYQGGD